MNIQLLPDKTWERIKEYVDGILESSPGENVKIGAMEQIVKKLNAGILFPKKADNLALSQEIKQRKPADLTVAEYLFLNSELTERAPIIPADYVDTERITATYM